MDTSENTPHDPETITTPPVDRPSAMPLSMPPVSGPTTANGAEAPAAGDAPITEPIGAMPITEPISAMPLSMPPTTARPAPATSEYPSVGGSGGTIPPTRPSWASEVPWPPRSAPVPGPSPKRGSRKALATLAAATLVAGGVGAGLGVALNSSAPSGGGSGALSAPVGPSTPTKALSVSAIYRLVSPAVVDINTVVGTPSSEGGSEQEAGTGMIVSSNGIILTNNHVIEGALKITVSIAGRSQTYSANVVGTSSINDVALIKVNGLSGLPTVSLGDSSAMQVGNSVVAVGNAQGLGGSPSTAAGSISALGRTITAGGEGELARDFTGGSETLHNLIETNAQIQPGDSGGPLLNSDGRVIGMDSAALWGDNSGTLGFAIPINQAKAIALAIEENKPTKANGVRVGLTPFLGIYGNSETSPSNGFGNISIGSNQACSTTGSTTTTAGVPITDVMTGGPAATVGLAGGDTITSINGKSVTSWNKLTSAVDGLKVGQKISIGYSDSCGSGHTTSLTVGGIPS